MFRILLACCLLAVAVPAAAQDNTLTVMTDRSLIEVRPLIAAYEQASGKRIQLMRPREGVRNELEKKYDTLAADIYLTDDLENLRDLRAAELTEPVWSGKLPRITSPTLRDPENHWFASEVTAEGRPTRRFGVTIPKSGMALLITSQNVPAAIEFMEFLVSDEARAIEANRLRN